jgi:hypothetical protein
VAESTLSHFFGTRKKKDVFSLAKPRSFSGGGAGLLALNFSHWRAKIFGRIARPKFSSLAALH